jgi:diguanylate cyclase (GGDEF)-like protein
MMPEQAARAELYDENVFKLLLDYEVARSQRYSNALSLLRIELALTNPTQTETINAPVALATILNMRMRRADIPAFFGKGFAILLPNTNEASARTVCDRLLRMMVGTQHTPMGFTTRVNICIGMSSHSGGAELSSEKLLSEAEAALKQALALGPQTYRVFTDTNLKK